MTHISYLLDSTALKITRQPQVVKCNNSSVTISVEAIGPGALSYTWKKDGEIITSTKYPDCIGLDTDTLTISPLATMYKGDYACIISNQDGVSIESELTTVTARGT